MLEPLQTHPDTPTPHARVKGSLGRAEMLGCAATPRTSSHGLGWGPGDDTDDESRSVLCSELPGGGA